MTRVTIIPDDRAVIVNGIGRDFDFTIDLNYHAVQWDGDKGYVETKTGDNKVLTDLSEFQAILDQHASILAKEEEDRLEALKPSQAHLESLRDRYAETYVYKGVSMKLSDGARADLTALYFQAQITVAIPDAQVMAVWQEKGFDPLPITAGDLRADGHLFAAHKQKCFAVAAQLNPSDYATLEELEAAFVSALNS